MSAPDAPMRPADPPAGLAEGMFRLFIESVREYAIFGLDPGGHVVSWNAGAERLKGYRREEALGRHLSTFYPPEKAGADVERALETAAREGQFRDEGWRVRKDGSRFWADVTLTAVRDAGGTLVGYAKVTRDMTARKRAQEQQDQLRHEQEARAEAQRTVGRLQALVDLSRNLAAAGLDFEAIARLIVRTAAEVVGEQAVLRLRRGDRLEAVAVHDRGADAGGDASAVEPEAVAGETPAARAFRSGHFVLASDDTSVLSLPLVVPGGEAVGVLSVARRHPALAYSGEDRLFVESLAFRSAMAFATARLYGSAHEAHERLRAVFQGIGEGLIVEDRAGRVVVANDSAARLGGFAGAAELTGAPMAEVIARFDLRDEEGRPFPLERLPARRAFAGEERPEALMRLRARGSQGERWSLGRATPLRDPDGTVVCAISIFEDVTDRRRVVERLRFLGETGEVLGSSLEYEKTLAAVARLAVPRMADWCTVDVFDERGRVRRLAAEHVDAARTAWAGEINERYPVDLAAGSGPGAVLRTGRPEIVAEITDEMLQAGARDDEHLRILQAARLRSYLCVPLVARDRIVGALTLITTEDSGRRYDEEDLTMAELLGRRAGLAVENARLYSQTQEALQQVTEISRLKDEFLATLSHELRTPLNAIVGWAQMLKSGALGGEGAQRAVETIVRNATLQTRLIGDILDVSRIITGKVRLSMRPVPPVHMVEQAIDTIRPAADAKGVRIEAVLDPAAGPVSADPERLQQVLWNLLSNAVKFVPRGGRVQVRLEAVNSHVEITVADNGPGVAPEFLPHVFERFRQADSSSTRAHGGLGLGLAIVRHLVELHGGQVRAANRLDGPGAVFAVMLPVAAVDAPQVVRPEGLPALPAARLPEGPSLAGVRVLLVDDEPEARDLLGIALEHSAAEVLRLATAREALAALPVFRPHVLLADVAMPGEDGYSLLQAVRRLPAEEGGLTPAVAITAYAGIEDRVRALAAGFDLHLAKPVHLDELRMAVARLAGHRR